MKANKLPLLPAVAAVGLSATITQLVLLREMLGALAGNELVLGVVLANWLLLTGLGASAGRWVAQWRHPVRWFVGLQTLLAVLPFAQVVALRLGRDAAFGHGTTVGLTETVLTSFILLLPYCLISGVLLTLACVIAGAARREACPPRSDAPRLAVEGEPPGEPQLASRDPARAIARIYIADALGSVLGGVLFSLVLVRFLDHLPLLAVPALLNLALASWLTRGAAGVACAVPAHGSSGILSAGDNRRHTAREHALGWWWLVPAALALGLVVVLIFLHPDAWLTQHQFPGQQILFRGQSPYGRLVITGTGDQPTFRENGVPLFTTGQIEPVEETVHFALAQRPTARRVLLLGGGVAGTVSEVLKYQPESVTHVELDPLILAAGCRLALGEFADPRLRVVTTDGRRFVQTTTERFDVVIVDMPDPVTLQLNRFYTVEFFQEVRRVLTPGGVLAFAVGRYENYLGPELTGLLGCGGATARAVFPQVLVLPGGRVWFLASDGDLTADIPARLETRGIATRFVRRHALTAILSPDRLDAVRVAAWTPSPVNADFRPRLLARQLEQWLREFSPRHAALALLAVLLPALLLIRWQPVPLAVLAGGFTAAALEVVLLLVFQVLYGSVYLQLGIIVTVFMAGLSAGAWLANRPTAPGRWWLTGVVTALLLLAVALPAALGLVARAGGGSAGKIGISGLTFLLAALVGAEFPLAGHLTSRSAGITAARLYAADFAGGCLGALAVSALLLPLGGVAGTCAVAAGLNLLVAAGLVVAGLRR